MMVAEETAYTAAVAATTTIECLAVSPASSWAISLSYR